MADPAQFALEPPLDQKFKASKAKEVMKDVLKAKLTAATYHADNTSSWAREIADEIKNKLKDQSCPRYKFVVQVFIGEQRGEGIRLACRGFWDTNTDNYATEIFSNESLFCVATAFGLYLY